MSVGYDPIRVRALAHRTRDAIEATRRLTSDDPAAGEALRAIAALRRTLDDHWLRALHDVLRSDALTVWDLGGPTDAGLPLRAPSTTAPACARSGQQPGRWAALDRDDLLGVVDDLDARVSSTSPPSDAELDELAAEIDRRIISDPDTVAAIVARAGELSVVAAVLARTAVGTEILVAALATMARPSGIVAETDIARHRHGVELLLGELVGDAAACLTALGDPDVLAAVAVWDDLDADLVETLVRTGLHDAVVAEPQRLAEGYGVLRALTELTNGSLDRAGLHPAMALGVATAMVGYVDTLAPAIRHEGAGRVLVVDHRHDDGRGLKVDLGSYDDLVDLVGSLLRDPAAGSALGTVLGGYARQRIDDLGADVAQPPGLEPVARFADLLADAARTEQAELVMEAAAAEARNRAIAGMVGFGAGVALRASGVGALTRSVATRAITSAAGGSRPATPGRLPDQRIAAGTYDLLVLGTIASAVDRPSVRRAGGLTSIPDTAWTEIGRRVDAIDRTDDPDERAAGLTRLERWIAVEAPELDRFLGQVRSAPGLDELTEARNAVGAD